MASLVRSLFKSSISLKLGFLTVLRVFHLIWMHVHRQVCELKVFSCSFFILLTVSLQHGLLIWMRASLLVCSFIDGAFSVVAEKSLPNPEYTDFPPAFQFFSFRFSMYVIHFKLIFYIECEICVEFHLVCSVLNVSL